MSDSKQPPADASSQDQLVRSLEEAARRALGRYERWKSTPVRDAGDAKVWQCLAWAMADDLKQALGPNAVRSTTPNTEDNHGS